MLQDLLRGLLNNCTIQDLRKRMVPMGDKGFMVLLVRVFETFRERVSAVEASTITAIISACISFMALFVTFLFNLRSHRQYISSLSPLLSFRLIEHNHILFLSVTNTGKSPAHKVRVEITGLSNNGDRNELHVDRLFLEKFELYPSEMTQGIIGFYGSNASQPAFPRIELRIDYVKGNTGKRCQYSRTVTFSTGFESKIATSVDMDTREIKDSLGSLSRSNVRIANYLDGKELIAIDEINLISKTSLRKDLCEALSSIKAMGVNDRVEGGKGQGKSANT